MHSFFCWGANMKDTVDVITTIGIQNLERGINFRVILDVKPTSTTNHQFAKRFPDGFNRCYDFGTFVEAYKMLEELNEQLNLPPPPVPSSKDIKEWNKSIKVEDYI